MRSLPTSALCRRAVLGVTATVTGAALAACGSTTAGTGGAKDAAAPAAKTAPGRATAVAAVDKAMATPVFTANPPVDMGKLAGKRITVLASTLAVPFVANIAKGAREAAGEIGWKATVVDGKGSVTEWSRVINQAVVQKVDGIITVGASPAQMKPAIAAAKKAGIPVVDTLTADQSRDPLVPGTFAHASISFYDSGRLQADYVIAHGTRDAHVLIFSDNEFPGEVTRVQGMRDEFTKLCPDCKLTVQDTQVATIGTDLQRTTQTLLRRDPAIAWVLPTYDAQGIYVVPAIKSAGLADKVKVVGSDAVSANLDLVAKGDVQVADVGEPDTWSGWAGVDMLGRALAGQRPVPPNIPLRLFGAGNLKGVDTQDTGALFGSSFRDSYKKVWGLS
ncbi:sugar ABC transporter substrate-binding protein [Streptomyces sulfonofaciens]|uniref:Sugar ABC transporter substrate-binding protein n=1 Tax=Streptomyces sulfonofaciens TaxID=68272 RepID=A0A919G7P6_9ACTN|nr:substrate-binding domain-containing protein [Streptomyces sulfonofaciens]GHH79371.1 sugar ABC transporter substrate-binding protein [Streptomyces sulfonofaciens]